MKKIILFVFITVVLCACASKSDNTLFYTFKDTQTVKPVSQRRITVDIERVKIPEYINRPQIVTVDGVNVNIMPDGRWAENLSPMIQRKLITDIGTYMPKASVKDSNFMADSGEYSVFVEIYKLDGALGDSAQLRGIYSIMGAGGETLKTKNMTYLVSAGDNYDEYVDAMGIMIETLARDIATELAK